MGLVKLQGAAVKIFLDSHILLEVEELIFEWKSESGKQNQISEEFDGEMIKKPENILNLWFVIFKFLKFLNMFMF